MPLSSNLKLYTNVEIKEIDKHGKILHTYRYKNLVVNIGRQQIAYMLGEGNSNKIYYVAWGDGGHDPSDPSTALGADATDTALGNELYRKVRESFSYPTTTSVKFVGQINAGELVGSGISEMALFHTDNTTLFARVTFPLIYHGANILTFNWTINI